MKSERDINKIWIAEGSQKGQMQSDYQACKRREMCSFNLFRRQKIDQMTEENHQGVIAQVAAYQYAELDDLFKRAAEKK